MLVLTREAGESLLIDLDGTEVTAAVVRVKGGRVRLAVEAPATIVVRNARPANRPADTLRPQTCAAALPPPK